MSDVNNETKVTVELNEEVTELQPESETNEEIENKKSSSSMTVSSVLFYVLIGLFVVSVLGNVYLFIKNRKLKNETVTAQNMSQKFEKENAMLEEKLISLNGENQELDRSLEDAFQNMADKDILIASLNKENETLRQIKSQIGEIELITNNLNTQVEDLSKAKLKLKAVQDNVNKTIDNKHAENRKIAEGLK